MTEESMMNFWIVYAISGLVIGSLAARKNRSGWAWGLIGGLFPILILGLLVLAFMPYLCPRCKQSITNKEWKNHSCPRCSDIGTIKKNSTQVLQVSSYGAIPSIHEQPDLGAPQPITTAEKTIPVASTSASFRDPTRLTQWLRYFLYASIAIDAIALFSGVLQYQLLSNFKLGIYSSGELFTAAAIANDQREKVIGLFQVGIAITTIILFAMWIYRANFNARTLGAQNMKFTPSWSVGYYFIPLLNLWRPYQAMKEIWKASKNPTSWESEERGAILPWWWFFYLIAGMFGNASLRTSISAKEIHELITSTGITIASDIVSIPATIVALVLVGKIYEMQMSHVQRRVRVYMKGWIRLGLVLSAFWVAGVVFFTAWQFFSIPLSACNFYTLENLGGAAAPADSNYLEPLHTYLFSCSRYTEILSSPPDSWQNRFYFISVGSQIIEFDIKHFVSLLFIPLALSWAASVSVVKSMQWVKNGFKS